MEVVPVWEKYGLSLDEAASYFNIGTNKLRELTNSPECESCVVFVGNKRLIKRKAFESFLSSAYSV